MDLAASYENGALSANPLRPLPEEILSEIFLYCVNEESPSTTTPPLTLTWVCRYWRRIALSLNRLWTQINLGERGADPSNDTRLLDLWVSRAGSTLPLDLKMCHEMKDNERPVFFDPLRGERYLVGMKFLVDKLLSISHRWRSLELHALDLYVLDPVLRGLVKGAPQLERLSVSTKYFDFFGSVHFIDLDSCPSLQSMRLLCPMLCPTLQSQVANSMTTLEIRFCPLMRDCLTWLSICPNLERLNVRFFRAVASSLPRDRSPLALKRLTHLTISCFSDDSDPCPLLDILHLPALSDFALDMNGLLHSELNDSWSDQLLTTIGRSNAPLERLLLLGTPMTSNALLRLLKITPHLKHLTLSGSAITDPLLYALAVNMSSHQGGVPDMGSGGISCQDPIIHSQCPLLESLELREAQCSFDALVALVISRAPRNLTEDSRYTKSLKKLALIWSPHRALQDHPVIRECIAAGLSIENRAYNTGKLLYVR